MQVLLRPCYDVGLQNRIFEQADERSVYWQKPMLEWRKKAKMLGIEIDTWDIHPIPEADVVVVQDLPAHKRELINAKKQAPKIPFVLLLYESTLDRSHLYNPANHELFDAVITYNSKLCDEKRYFHYQLPVGRPDLLPSFLAFDERKSLVMINTNKYNSILAQRGPGLTGLPVVGPYLGNWEIEWRETFHQQKKELCSRRRKIARLAETDFSNLLEIYGKGWQGEAISWIHKFSRSQPYKCAMGSTTQSKLDTLSQYRFCLAFENITGNYGYISEKIFDSLFAGTVPIYLGDENITTYVVKDSFVDARQFSNDSELLKYVKTCSKKTWKKMYEAGQAYLQSKEIETFLENRFADRMLEVIHIVTKQSSNK